ncbi:MAG: ribosome biogenesis GTPase Der [candidate division KSB1 bacterium]|nr:ribosome biogenesis GTPase Der [candidate division KSB1 bacterium]
MNQELDKPVVAIVGRPNVGKSTLFNRILRQQLAIVDDQPGVTRDRLYGEAEWGGRRFVLIDTGGYVPETEDLIEQAVREQVQYALEEATAILFVCDAQVGVTPLDQQIARDLSRRGKPVILVANKADSARRELDGYEFYQLGLGDPVPISATLGRRIGDLLDRLVSLFPPPQPRASAGAADESVRIAVVGRPNVGKSSFINAVLGQPKLIVTEIPGTTRDSIDTLVEYRGQRITLIDTAGLRRRSRIREAVEFYSTVRTHRAIRRSEVVVLMIDADEGLAAQDKRILEEILEAKRGAVLAVNKWDLLQKDTELAERYRKALQEELRIYSYVPIVFTSALRNWRVTDVLDAALAVSQELRKRIDTHEVNRFLQEALAAYPPPAYGTKYVKIKYAAQVATGPPVFAFFCNIPKGIKASYRQYLENRLRERFGFQGVPLVLTFRRK